MHGLVDLTTFEWWSGGVEKYHDLVERQMEISERMKSWEVMRGERWGTVQCMGGLIWDSASEDCLSWIHSLLHIILSDECKDSLYRTWSSFFLTYSQSHFLDASEWFCWSYLTWLRTTVIDGMGSWDVCENWRKRSNPTIWWILKTSGLVILYITLPWSGLRTVPWSSKQRIIDLHHSHQPRKRCLSNTKQFKSRSVIHQAIFKNQWDKYFYSRSPSLLFSSNLKSSRSSKAIHQLMILSYTPSTSLP